MTHLLQELAQSSYSYYLPTSLWTLTFKMHEANTSLKQALSVPCIFAFLPHYL